MIYVYIMLNQTSFVQNVKPPKLFDKSFLSNVVSNLGMTKGLTNFVKPFDDEIYNIYYLSYKLHIIMFYYCYDNTITYCIYMQKNFWKPLKYGWSQIFEFFEKLSGTCIKKSAVRKNTDDVEM